MRSDDRPSEPVWRPSSSSPRARCGGGEAPREQPMRRRHRPPRPAPPGAPRSSTLVLHDARLDLDPAAWQALRENYLDNQYYAANLTVDG